MDLLQRIENCNPLKVLMITSANMKAYMTSTPNDVHLMKLICGSHIYAKQMEVDL